MSGISIDINFSGAHKLFRIAESQNRGIDEVLPDAIKLYDFINSNKGSRIEISTIGEINVLLQSKLNEQ